LTKYRYFLLIAALIVPSSLHAATLDPVFAPRKIPGLSYAELPVPVAQAARPTAPAPSPETAPAAPEHEPTLWERLKSLFE